jgi:hypothetical protein
MLLYGTGAARATTGAETIQLFRRWQRTWLTKFGTRNCLKIVRRRNSISIEIQPALPGAGFLAVVQIDCPKGTITLRHSQLVREVSGRSNLVGGGGRPSQIGGGGRGRYEMEEISFAFQQIKYTWTSGGVTVPDDWLSGDGTGTDDWLSGGITAPDDWLSGGGTGTDDWQSAGATGVDDWLGA